MNAIFPGDKYTISMMEFILKVCEDCPYFFSISTPAILQPGMSKSQTHVCISLHWWFNWWYHEATVTTLHPPLYALVNSTLKPGLYRRTPHLHMHIGEMTKSLNWKGTLRALKLIFEVHLSQLTSSVGQSQRGQLSRFQSIWWPSSLCRLRWSRESTKTPVPLSHQLLFLGRPTNPSMGS